MASRKGQLLIASQLLQDPNFAKAVVLLVQHNASGAIGVIVNRPLKTTVKEAILGSIGTHCDVDDPLYLGGPCEGPLMAVYADETASESDAVEPDVGDDDDDDDELDAEDDDADDEEADDDDDDDEGDEPDVTSGGGIEQVVIAGVRFAAARDTIERLLLDADRGDAKFFLNYSGWGHEQLENEIKAGAWVVVPATPENIFHGSDKQWLQLLIEATSGYRFDAEKIPDDPTVN